MPPPPCFACARMVPLPRSVALRGGGKLRCFPVCYALFRHLLFPSVSFVSGRPNKAKEAEHRQTQVLHWPRHAGECRHAPRVMGRGTRHAIRCCHLAAPGARSPAGVPPRLLRQRTNATAQFQRRASWDVARDGRYPPPPVPVQRFCPQAGRNAGRASSRNRPRAGLTRPRPQEPLPLRRPESPGRRPSRAGLNRHVTISVTIVNRNVTVD